MPASSPAARLLKTPVVIIEKSPGLLAEISLAHIQHLLCSREAALRVVQLLLESLDDLVLREVPLVAGGQLLEPLLRVPLLLELPFQPDVGLEFPWGALCSIAPGGPLARDGFLDLELLQVELFI